MYIRFLLIAFLALISAPLAFAQPSQEIAQTEREFARDAKDFSFIYGFNKFAAPNSIWFNPEARSVQEDLREMRKIPSLLQSSKLRWWPYHIGIANSGDFGFDLGPWYIEGTQKSGFFFTIWNNIAPGIWAYSLDTGAGKVTNRESLPDKDTLKIFNKKGKSKPKPEYLRFENEANLSLAENSTGPEFSKYIYKDAILATEDKEFVPNNSLNSVQIGQIPRAIWKNNGFLFASSGDMAASFGDIKDNRGKILGEYVRLWFTEDVIGAAPKIYIQIYRPRNP